MIHKNRIKIRNFKFRSAGCFLLRAEGFSWSLEVSPPLYGGLGICTLQFLKKITLKLFPTVNIFQFLFIKTLHPDWIRIRIGIQPEMLDLDSMNTDPKHWFQDESL
jgi:hypothetical protein